MDLVGDPRPFDVLAAQRFLGEPVEPPPLTLELRPLALRRTVEQVEFLARGDHLGQGRRRRAAAVGGAIPLLGLPAVQGERVAQDPRSRQDGVAVQSLDPPCGPPQRQWRDTDLLGDGDRLPWRRPAHAQHGDLIGRAARSWKREQPDARLAASAGRSPGAHGACRDTGRAATAEGEADVRRAHGDAERRIVLPAGHHPRLDALQRQRPQLGRPQEAGDRGFVHPASVCLGQGAPTPGVVMSPTRTFGRLVSGWSPIPRRSRPTEDAAVTRPTRRRGPAD